MFVYYLITRWKELGKINGKEYIVKTIVTTETIKTIAERNGVEMYDVYTGFKWIANVMRENEGKKKLYRWWRGKLRIPLRGLRSR